MKKLLAAFVLVIISAAGAFAEVTIGGSVGGGVTFLKGTNVRTDELQAGGYLSGNISASAADETGTFGGDVQINAEANTTNPGAWAWSASVWWKPIYFLQASIGSLNQFALTEIVGWGFHANDADTFVAFPQSNYVGDYFSQTTGFFAGTGESWTGFTLSANPVYGLDINVAVPFGRVIEERDPNTGEIISKFNAGQAYMYASGQVAYTLWGAGRLAFSYAANGDGKLNLPNTAAEGAFINLNEMTVNAHSFYASFLLTAFEEYGFGLNVGVGYTLPAMDPVSRVTYYTPLEAGLGVSVGTAEYGVKARLAATFMGKATRATGEVLPEPFMIGFGILPYYSFGPISLYLNLGVSWKAPDYYMPSNDGLVYEVGNSTALGWHANPYMTFVYGSGRFFAGLYVESDGLKYVGTNQQAITDPSAFNGVYPGQPIIRWGVPIGILFEF